MQRSVHTVWPIEGKKIIERVNEKKSEKKDRGRSVIFFDYGLTTTEGEDEERQFSTMLCVVESETKATLCVPVIGKGSVP